jgi:hypothetical protein
MNKKTLELIVNLKDLILWCFAFSAIWFLDDIRLKLLGVVLMISVMTRQ